MTAFQRALHQLDVAGAAMQQAIIAVDAEVATQEDREQAIDAAVIVITAVAKTGVLCFPGMARLQTKGDTHG